mmetsp:Transcript_19685/g.34916  ORF Transcript_19685/g.34916 Transcript_19685/m.34916 type:complete len:872 (+) Transcript_19685:152-2767(+)|eukprot:CAMPEP_0197667808 /NCGR_PEP_ID=MMETSP1338-20131121/67484_1 /TAXON_ID=43686 ORGANISM="Pelagodinium beii, Strain RCC1491" /NCGR_SAMPLE_ID=MMETSP1338 /ASSEMBLY_ACC=CAM_ASM_000754 /LENGTH=871 /DNA_ID=CAMNT_0043247133 /DNA_START=53 /DNA_END=2664 /DNA_ORIENTATION=+
MVDVVGAGLAGVGGVLYKLFGYNRENFKYDREQRAIMEYQLLEARLKQVGLWRQDVRDAIQLTPEKMEVYLTVIALELTGALTCLCKGRVPSGAPPWLVSSGVLAVCSAQTFLFLGLWFGLHAFVASQAYKVRILTQLVRLPIPTWAHMEAARTYGSDFESMKSKQMLRVPLLTGSQERWVGGDGADPSNRAADPWGLERTGEGISELDPEVNGSMIEKQRHVWLIRESAKFFNTYDAFCRVCLSVGTSSLAIFFCFYCLAYVCTELAAPVGAWGGMIIFSAITLLLLRTDQILRRSQYVIGSFLLFLSPVFCAVVTFLSSKSWGNPGSTEYLVPIGLFLEGCWYIYFLYLIQATGHQTGAVLPRSFRAVLYVDAFGWAKHSSSYWQAVQSKLFASRRGSFGSFASASSDTPLKNKLPATLCAGAGRPLRPEDAKREVAAVKRGPLVANPAEFLREESLADDDDHHDEQAHKTESFRPGTFASFKKDPREEDNQIEQEEEEDFGGGIVGEKAGVQPWRAFFWSTALLAVMWWCAAIVAFYDVQTGAADFRSGNYGIKPGEVLPMEALLGVKVTTSWDSYSEPHGFACDMDGSVFATAGRSLDGRRSVLEGQLGDNGKRVDFVASPTCSGLPETAMIQDLALHKCEGLDKGSCSAVVLPLGGTQLVSCPMSASSRGASSFAEINGAQTVTSSLAGPSLKRSWLEDRGGSPLDEHLGLGSLLHPEEMTALSAVPCAGAGPLEEQSCLVVGTTARRIVHLSGNSTAGESSWLPRRLLQKEGLEVPGPGSFAVLGGGRYLGVLHREANTVHILDMHAGGLNAGLWKLPSPAEATKTGTGGHFSGICAGGDSLYALQSGAKPAVWRFAHPKLPDIA